ncbi:MAG: oxidoreductase [Frankiales bacterium]|nr:oxidoreductase [Frankiales bacterium]
MRTDYNDYDEKSGNVSPPPDPTRDHIQGPSDAPVQLVEYGDYQCPFCGQAHPIVKAVQRAMGDQMAFAFRHFPLVQIHPMAEPAAEAAEAAGAQGRFWQMHDEIYEHQRELSVPGLLVMAAAADVPELDRVATDLAERRFAAKVLEDFETGVRSGVPGTPSFFINGRRHHATFDLPTLLGAVQSELLRVAR